MGQLNLGILWAIRQLGSGSVMCDLAISADMLLMYWFVLFGKLSAGLIGLSILLVAALFVVMQLVLLC